jgi:hypothetical protein
MKPAVNTLNQGDYQSFARTQGILKLYLSDSTLAKT